MVHHTRRIDGQRRRIDAIATTGPASADATTCATPHRHPRAVRLVMINELVPGLKTPTQLRGMRPLRWRTQLRPLPRRTQLIAKGLSGAEQLTPGPQLRIKKYTKARLRSDGCHQLPTSE
jgi:hypothetical protein